MAGIDLTTAEAKLAEYLAAETKVLKNQRVVIDGTELTKANLDLIQKGIEIWNGRVQRLSRTRGLRVRQVIPI